MIRCVVADSARRPGARTAALASLTGCGRIPGVSIRDQAAAMNSAFGQRSPEVVVMTLSGFAQASEAVLAVQQQRTVVLHLEAMPNDEAQRTIDFVSGGVFALDGQSERLGELVFLFAPALVRIERDRESESKP